MTANKKARAIKDLITFEKFDIDVQFDDFFNAYKDDVLDMRNQLAHAKAKVENGKEYLIIDDQGTEEYIIFDQQKAIEIRKNLLYYSQFLKKLKISIDAL